MVIASNGVIIRLHSEDIRTISRSTMGVKLMKITGDDTVMCLSLSERQDDEENIGEEQNVVQNENNEEIEAEVETATETSKEETSTEE